MKAAWMLPSKKSEFGEAVNELTNPKNYILDYHIMRYKPSDLARDQWAAEIIRIPIHCHDWLEISKKLGMSLQILAKQAIVNSDSEIVEHKLKPLFACLRSLVQNLSPLKQGWSFGTCPLRGTFPKSSQEIVPKV